MLGNPRPRPPLNLARQVRLGPPQRLHSFAQPQGIQFIDGKRPIAALRATGSAHQPVPSPPSRILERRINNLDKSGVTGWESHIAKHTPMPVSALPHYVPVLRLPGARWRAIRSSRGL